MATGLAASEFETAEDILTAIEILERRANDKLKQSPTTNPNFVRLLDHLKQWTKKPRLRPKRSLRHLRISFKAKSRLQLDQLAPFQRLRPVLLKVQRFQSLLVLVRSATASQLKSFQAVQQLGTFGAALNLVRTSSSNSQFGQAVKVAALAVGGYIQPFAAFSLKSSNAGKKDFAEIVKKY
jgi:hypothetical protein